MQPISSSGPPPPSERLMFRTWTRADLPLAVALWTDPDVMRHMGGARTPEQAEARLLDEMQTMEQLGIQYWPIFLRATGEHAGCSGLRPFHGSRDELEVGVHLARACWSGRLGEEAARAVIAHAWRATGAKTLVAGHGPQNEASKSLIHRLGFVYSHDEAWGPLQMMHPFYRLARPAALNE